MAKDDFDDELQIVIISRAEWKAKPPHKPIRDEFTPYFGGVVIHHHGDGKDFPRKNHRDCFEQVRQVQEGHMNPSIWRKILRSPVYDDIAYNYVVCQHGSVFEGRGGNVRSAANDVETPGANKNYFAVMGLIESGDKPSAAMITAIRDLISHLREHERAGGEIKGHRDVATTKCPGHLYPFVTNGSLEPDRN